MKLVALQSVISVEAADTLGYLLPLWPRRFRRTYVVLLQHWPLYLCKYRFILSCTYLFFRVCDHCRPVRITRKHPNTTREVSSPIATSRFRVHLRTGLPRSNSRSALSVSRTLDGLLLAILCELISFRYHVGFTLQGFSPLPSQLDSSPSRPLMLFVRSFLPLPKQRCQILRPQLQGLKPSSDP
jgi:hypothetical protein